MSSHAPRIDSANHDPAERERIAKLLQRYPKIGEDEVTEVISFLRKGPHLDVGMLTGDERLKPKLDAFMADHRRHFTLRAGEVAAVVAGIIGMLLLLWAIWEALR